MFNHKQIYQSDVQLALSEDLRDKDLSDGIIKDQTVTAFLKAKDDGLFCGQDWFEESFKQIDKNIEIHDLDFDQIRTIPLSDIEDTFLINFLMNQSLQILSLIHI